MRFSITCLAMLLFAAPVFAAPISDNSIYHERFLDTVGNTADDSDTNVIGTGAYIDNGQGYVNSSVGTEGVVRASNLGIGAAQEWVLEYDWTLLAEAGDNFYMLFVEDNSSPYNSSIQMRAYPVDAIQYGVQVDYGSGQFESFNLEFSETYHITLHHRDATNNDLYIDGQFIGTYADRNDTLGVNLIQFGDSSTGSGYGFASVDNISIGNVAPSIPEPASLALLSLGMFAAMNRRSNPAQRAS